MIRTHFKQSQFLVISLKEGMFNNANVIFRTKFEDGVSTITRTVRRPGGPDTIPHEEPPSTRLPLQVPAMAMANQGKQAAGAPAAARKALTAMN